MPSAARPIRVRMESQPAGKRVRTELTAEVAAPPPVVRRLVWEVDAWPGLFPHIVSVSRVDLDVYRVRLTWRGIPFTSDCRRISHPPGNRVVFQSIGGIARGLQGVWEIDQIDESRTNVRLSVECRSRIAGIKLLLCGQLCRDLAQQTLAMVTLLAEADAAAHALA